MIYFYYLPMFMFIKINTKKAKYFVMFYPDTKRFSFLCKEECVLYRY